MRKMSAGKRVISCKELRESLAAYLDDKLTLEDRELIESHLSGCQQCSKELDAAVGIHDRMIKASDALSDQITPLENIWLGIKSRLAVEESAADTAWGLARAKFLLGKEIVMKALFSKQPVWKLAAINGFVIIALVIGLTLGLPSSGGQTAYAQVEQIARDSQEVQDALGGPVATVEAIRLQGDIGTAVCSGATGGMAAVTVDIGSQSVTDVSPLDLTQDELQRAVNVAMNDSRVADLVDEGAVIGDIRPGYTLGYGAHQGATVEILPNIMITAGFSLTMDDQEWQVVVNLDEGKVQTFAEVPKISDMLMPSEEDTQRGLDIANADPEVQELLAQGAVVDDSSIGSSWTVEEDGTISGLGITLEKGDSRWIVFIDLVKGEVTGVQGPHEEISAEEEEEFFSYKYAFGPLQVRDILDAIESDQSVRALILAGAEVIGMRPVLEWECDTANVSGVQQQVCHQKDGDVEQIDVMLGMGAIWWDVIFDMDSQEVVEIREYSYNAGGSNTGSGSTSTAAGQSVDWATTVVSLAADDFYIEADGVKYVANVQSVEVYSDPGDSEFCTLELTWNEHGNEMRLLMYFVSDGTYWWSDEIRTYDSQSPYSDWIYYTGEFFKTKLGSSFVGDRDLTSDAGNAFQGEIHFKGLELQAFLNAD